MEMDAVFSVDKAPLDAVEVKRIELRSQPGCVFVDPTEFLRLATSARRLVRSDEGAAQIRGLYEPATGKRFFTEQEKLESMEL